MNWEVLAEKYPNSYKEIKEFSKVNKFETSDKLMRGFLHSKGYYCGMTWINHLKTYETKLEMEKIDLELANNEG